jgi:hypothetical protein
MSQKKYCEYWGVVLPLPPPPSLPQGNRNPNRGPTVSSPYSFHISLSPLSLLISILSSYLNPHFPLSIHLFPSPPLLSPHLIMSSCHVIMSVSYCHTHMSLCHTHIYILIQIKYEIKWIILMKINT